MRTIVFTNIEAEDRAFFEPLLAQNSELCSLFYENSPSAIEDLPAEMEVLCVNHIGEIKPDLLAKFSSLRLIATRSTGFNHIDIETAKQRGIQVVNVPSYGERTVAEFTFTLMLALTRKLLPAVKGVLDGTIDYSRLRGSDLASKTLGIIGTGKIGRHVAEIANSFAMQILAYDVYPNEELCSTLGLKYVDIDELLVNSDIITLHVPSTPENKYLLRNETFAKMKPGALLINTARGDLVNTSDMIRALSEGQLAGAALDVIEGEDVISLEAELSALYNRPSMRELELAVEHDVLKHMSNVILTPHIAFDTLEALQRIRQTTYDNLIAWLNGETLNSVE